MAQFTSEKQVSIKGNNMMATIHRTINTILILLVAIVLFATLNKLTGAVKQEHTLPQCEEMLLEKIQGDGLR